MATRTNNTNTSSRRISLTDPEVLQTLPVQSTFSPHKLAVTSLQEQRRRQRISNDWEPRGFDRYQYQQALLRSMNVLGGIGGDEELSGSERYEPASPCQETLDCHCTGPYGE